jgi:hypothetical protein
LVHRSDGTGALLKSGDVLDGGDVLPGFRCPVADLFTGPSQSVSLELDTVWDQIASAVGMGIQSRSQNR